MTLGRIIDDRFVFLLSCGCTGHTLLNIDDAVLQKKTAGKVGHTLGGVAIEITSRNPTCPTHNPNPPARYYLAANETEVVPGY